MTPEPSVVTSQIGVAPAAGGVAVVVRTIPPPLPTQAYRVSDAGSVTEVCSVTVAVAVRPGLTRSSSPVPASGSNRPDRVSDGSRAMSAVVMTEPPAP